jgi:hypothetical protein
LDINIFLHSEKYAELATLHRSSFGSAAKAMAAFTCTCFHCYQSFAGCTIVNVKAERDGSETALCPYCGMDSVLSSSVSNTTLKDLYIHYFTSL